MRNILVILCDQLRRDFLSMYGGVGVPTPNLDRLAATGTVFDNAITQSTVCAPARASMMTGRYVSDHMVWTNDVPFRQGMEYLPERMNELGYATGAFGKLHHFPANDGKGFQHLRQMEEGRLGQDEPYLKWLKARRPEITRVWNHGGFVSDLPAAEHYEHWIASEAMEFATEAAASRRPFLAWVSFQGPHGPIDPPNEVKGTVDGSALPAPLVRRMQEPEPPQTVVHRTAFGGLDGSEERLGEVRTAYAEQIVFIDMQIGRILRHLEEIGALERTSILFSADHGDMLGDFGLNGKGPFPYPAQMDIPLVLANHPGVQAGARSVALAGNIDLPGTVLDIAGSDRPIGYSRSLVELAAVAGTVGEAAERAEARDADGGRAASRGGREIIFSEFCDSVKTVDDGRFRFSYYPFQGARELYDRRADPLLYENLAGRPDYAELESRMLAHIVDFTTVAKGVRVEAQDFVPKQQEGLRAKHPDYRREYPVAFPLTKQAVELLEAAGCDASYNEFCRDKEVIRYYGKPYWM